MQERERESIATRAAMIGILANLFLFIVKYLLSLLLHSLSIGADAWNNLSDMGNSISVFLPERFPERRQTRSIPLVMEG